MFRHALAPLLAPASVALVGAGERPGSLGRIVWENLRAASPKGPLYAVNPKHRELEGGPCYARLRDLPSPPELAVFVTPAHTLPALIEEAGEAGVRAAVVLSSGFGDAGAPGRQLEERMLAAARRHHVRLLGPNCLGLMRTDTGLDATFSPARALPGRLALVSQSGAICTAILDWARPAGVGFTSIVSLGAAADVDFGEILDFLVEDASTEAILMYVEGVRDARRFLSALRAAARVKPVVALKVGRYASGSKAASSHSGALVGSDAVFDAAFRRSGTVRVRSYTQLFAAARMLATRSRLSGERLAILTNGGGPGVMAADAAAENGVPLAVLSESTLARMNAVLPAQWSRGNPADIIGDAPATRYSDATRALLEDPKVDALLAMYSPVAVTSPADAARAVVEGAAQAAGRKLVIAAWLGDLRPGEGRRHLDANGIPDFFTPENAVEAFSYLCAYRRNQSQLLEVPGALARTVGASAANLDAAFAIRATALAQGRTILNEDEAKALLRAFGIPVPPSVAVDSAEAAMAAARDMGLPVVLKILSPDITHKSDVGGVRLNLQDADMVVGAFDGMVAHVRRVRPDARIEGAVVQPMLRFANAREVLVGVATDPVFGPIVSFGAGGVAVEAVRDAALALPPLNAVLARELISRTRVARLLAAYRGIPAADEASLIALLLGVSDMVCALPWLREMDLNPVLAHPGGVAVADARVVIDPDRPLHLPRYRHMAIHPYPAELESTIRLRDGTALRMRPMRPEDAALERAFVQRMSEQSRFLRFHSQLADLPPELLARFTQLDYDRELALVVLAPEGDGFVAVGRYAPNSDGETAEFALAVLDAWHGRGLGRILLERLCDCAKSAGYRALEGHVLSGNPDMLVLAEDLGFRETAREGGVVTVTRAL